MSELTTNERELQDTIVNIASTPVQVQVKDTVTETVPQLSLEQLVGQLLKKLVDLDKRIEDMADKAYVDHQAILATDDANAHSDAEIEDLKYGSWMSDAATEAVSDALDDDVPTKFNEWLEDYTFKLVKVD